MKAKFWKGYYAFSKFLIILVENLHSEKVRIR